MRKQLTLAVLAVVVAVSHLSAQGTKFIVVVNPKNPIARLNTTQMSKIYLGKLQAWDINGQIEPVAPVDQLPDSPLRAAFSQRVLHRTVNETASYWRQELFAGRNVPPPEQSENDALETVRSTVGGIAYVSDKADLSGVKVVLMQ